MARYQLRVTVAMVGFVLLLLVSVVYFVLTDGLDWFVLVGLAPALPAVGLIASTRTCSRLIGEYEAQEAADA